MQTGGKTYVLQIIDSHADYVILETGKIFSIEHEGLTLTVATEHGLCQFKAIGTTELILPESLVGIKEIPVRVIGWHQDKHRDYDYRFNQPIDYKTFEAYVIAEGNILFPSKNFSNTYTKLSQLDRHGYEWRLDYITPYKG